MLPRINNKELFGCNAADFEVILHNPDYRENQYLDYKENFTFLNVSKEKAPPKITEFRNDICSFANSEGGYIIYGISDDQGTAKELIGIDIENPDRFELDLRNKLNPILPKIPSVRFHFILLDNGRYLVVIFIEHDYYAPYIHIEDQKNYKIYKRDGNQKTIIGYTELKNMFMQSRFLEDEILGFRKKRIEYYNSEENEHNRYMLYHIIPESFLSDRKDLFIIEKRHNLSFGTVFAGTKIDSLSLPCVDGLRYVNTAGDEEAILYDNGVAEFLLPLTTYVIETSEGLQFYNEEIWNYIDHVSQGYQKIMPEIFGNQRYFGCVSISGCKGAITEENGYGRHKTRIDRNKIICHPVPFLDMRDKELFYSDLKRLHLEYLLSVGIRRSSIVSELVEAVANS